MPENEKLVQNLSKSNTAFAPKPGCAVLPKSRLSLWAAVLTLIGALGLLGYRLVDPINFSFSWEYFTSFSRGLELLEALALLTVSILLFTTRASGRNLKTPSLIWGVGTLFMLPAAIYGFVQTLRQYDLLMAYYILLIYAIPVAAAVFAILYAFNALKKRPVLIIIGVLLGAVFIAGTYSHIIALSAYTNYPISPFDPLYIRFGFILLYYLLFPTGMFLAFLASKPKAAE
ncbi:MAG TPA: hypothetical protein PK629_01530 [Oscillospiraceae bacterium]|nr:hypothetical protein [Oscillospiraceae bacterium]HPF55229.1 hypothetical protein [Clostridiales bacterium]HPK35281.1 hypothetical protein [Oscillospiraceae bacterium]HPR75474.1 hypothetical protein [Oscillospiraceae bacterium]